MTDTAVQTQLLQPHDKDLGGGFKVRRLLPAAQRRSVGPFVFFDHFGPATEQPGAEHDVRPHPHIGLSTVTYLFEGAMMHRDSLGSVQEILPGAINWMTAGRGIVHSERKPERLKADTYVNHGLQLWAALPQAHEEVEPSFEHTPAGASCLPSTAIRRPPEPSGRAHRRSPAEQPARSRRARHRRAGSIASVPAPTPGRTWGPASAHSEAREAQPGPGAG